MQKVASVRPLYWPYGSPVRDILPCGFLNDQCLSTSIGNCVKHQQNRSDTVPFVSDFQQAQSVAALQPSHSSHCSCSFLFVRNGKNFEIVQNSDKILLPSKS